MSPCSAALLNTVAVSLANRAKSVYMGCRDAINVNIE